MKRWICFVLILAFVPVIPAKAEPIKWVNFDVPYESLKYAMDTDIATAEQEKHISWIDILALSACRTGGKCGIASVKKAVNDLKGDKSPEELLGNLYKYYSYYHEAYTAVLGGMLGNYSVEINGQWKSAYGLKAFSPIAAGYGYSHCSDFGNSRSFGIAVEGGIVEAIGWNRYGGWRIGIRSFDSKRYYYYAHLQKDTPFAKDIYEGRIVQPGDIIGFMGRTGYSDKENTNNIETVHLHFGMQLVFDESQKECNSEIWIDVYNIVKLLSNHRSSVRKTDGLYTRVYPFVDLDTQMLLEGQ